MPERPRKYSGNVNPTGKKVPSCTLSLRLLNTASKGRLRLNESCRHFMGSQSPLIFKYRLRSLFFLLALLAHKWVYSCPHFAIPFWAYRSCLSLIHDTICCVYSEICVRWTWASPGKPCVRFHYNLWKGRDVSPTTSVSPYTWFGITR